MIGQIKKNLPLRKFLKINKKKVCQLVEVQHVSLQGLEVSFLILFSIHFQILLTLHPSLPCSAQEQIIEYSFFMSRTLESPSNDSIFFHPWFLEDERATFQQQLVMSFNKLSSEDPLQSSVTDLTTALLISAPLTLNKALQEGVKSTGHTKTICSVSIFS